MTPWQMEYLAIIAASGLPVIPSGGVMDVVFADAVGATTVDTIADRINGRSWVGNPQTGNKWLTNTTEKPGHTVGYLDLSFNVPNVEFIDVTGDTPCANLGASVSTGVSLCWYARIASPSSEQRGIAEFRAADTGGGASTNFGFWANLTSTTYSLSMGGSAGGTGGGALSSGFAPAALGWHSGALTYDGATVKLYINAALIGSVAQVINNVSGITRGYVAKFGSSLNSGGWRGGMGRATIYPFGITAADVSAWHLATLALYA